MKAPNALEQAIALAVFDEARRPEFVRAVMTAELWFPMDYHPELDNPARPDANAHIPFWIVGDDTGKFVPVFSGPQEMRKQMQRLRKPYTRAVLPGGLVLAAALRQGHIVRINPGARYTARLDLEALAGMVSGDMLAREGQPPEQGQATLKFLPVAAWPEKFLADLAEECEEQPGVLAVWLGLAGDESPERGHLHIVIWVRDREHTTIDNLHRAVIRQWPDRKVEYVRMGQAADAEALAVMRDFAPVFPRVAG